MTTPIHPDLQTRLDFIGLDENSRARLKLIEAAVDTHLPRALDRLYDKIAQVPEVSRFFSGRDQMARAHSSQVGHWREIARARFDNDYLQSSTRIGNRHALIGLEPRWYIGGYGIVIETLVRGVVHDYMAEELKSMRKLRHDAVLEKIDIMAAAVAEMIRAIMLDIDIAVSIYYDRLTEEARETEQRNAARIQRTVDLTGEALRSYADGDLDARITAEFEPEFSQIKDDINAVGERFGAIVGQLRQTSSALRTATSEILTGASDLADRTTRQAATIEQTSAAMETLARTVAGNARDAEQASAKAQAAARAAEDSGRIMDQTTAAMERITASSSKVSDIIGLIDSVAFQTNLLALNASVEAARAGEAGKGFAVVAVEVRRLAQSAAQASSEIKGLIDQSGQEVAAGALLVSDASVRLAGLLDAVRENATLLETIASGSRTQAESIEEVNDGVRLMDQMTQHNAALVEQTNAAIAQTEAQAVELDTIVDVFVTSAPRSTPRAA